MRLKSDLDNTLRTHLSKSAIVLILTFINFHSQMATHMSFTIISIVLAGIFLILFGVATSQFSSCAEFDFYYYQSTSRRDCNIGRGLGAFFMVLLFVELIAAFLSSILCCTAICCKRQVCTFMKIMKAILGS